MKKEHESRVRKESKDLCIFQNILVGISPFYGSTDTPGTGFWCDRNFKDPAWRSVQMVRLWLQLHLTTNGQHGI